MNRWQTPCGGAVYMPASLAGLPRYKADAFRLFMAGTSGRLIRGTA